MTAKINLNGSSADDLIDQQMVIYSAAQALEEALMAAAPHGRDYQLNPDDYLTDRLIWADNCAKVAMVRQMAANTGSNLILQKNHGEG